MSKDKSNKSLNGAGQNRPKVRRRRFKFGKFILYILIGCLLVFTAFPMVAMISRAFMPLEELFIYPPRIFVHSPT